MTERILVSGMTSFCPLGVRVASTGVGAFGLSCLSQRPRIAIPGFLFSRRFKIHNIALNDPPAGPDSHSPASDRHSSPPQFAAPAARRATAPVPIGVLVLFRDPRARRRHSCRAYLCIVRGSLHRNRFRDCDPAHHERSLSARLCTAPPRSAHAPIPNHDSTPRPASALADCGAVLVRRSRAASLFAPARALRYPPLFHPCSPQSPGLRRSSLSALPSRESATSSPCRRRLPTP